jgi:hypothetical protein
LFFPCWFLWNNLYYRRGVEKQQQKKENKIQKKIKPEEKKEKI